jgi:hypothetical protein
MPGSNLSYLANLVFQRRQCSIGLAFSGDAVFLSADLVQEFVNSKTTA